MFRTLAATSFAVILGLSSLATAGADQLNGQTRFTSCEMTKPWDPTVRSGIDGTWGRDSIPGGDGTTGPTFPSSCRPTI